MYASQTFTSLGSSSCRCLSSTLDVRPRPTDVVPDLDQAVEDRQGSTLPIPPARSRSPPSTGSQPDASSPPRTRGHRRASRQRIIETAVRIARARAGTTPRTKSAPAAGHTAERLEPVFERTSSSPTAATPGTPGRPRRGGITPVRASSSWRTLAAPAESVPGRLQLFLVPRDDRRLRPRRRAAEQRTQWSPPPASARGTASVSCLSSTPEWPHPRSAPRAWRRTVNSARRPRSRRRHRGHRPPGAISATPRWPWSSMAREPARIGEATAHHAGDFLGDTARLGRSGLAGVEVIELRLVAQATPPRQQIRRRNRRRHRRPEDRARGRPADAPSRSAADTWVRNSAPARRTGSAPP